MCHLKFKSALIFEDLKFKSALIGARGIEREEGMVGGVDLMGDSEGLSWRWGKSG